MFLNEVMKCGGFFCLKYATITQMHHKYPHGTSLTMPTCGQAFCYLSFLMLDFMYLFHVNIQNTGQTQYLVLINIFEYFSHAQLYRNKTILSRDCNSFNNTKLWLLVFQNRRKSYLILFTSCELLRKIPRWPTIAMAKKLTT